MHSKVSGTVVRVSMAGYGVIKSAEWGEVMWRQYELPNNLRTMQFADKAKFQREVEGREDYKRLKEMEGRDVEAEDHYLPDGQLRASHVRAVQPGGAADHAGPQRMLEDRPHSWPSAPGPGPGSGFAYDPAAAPGG